MPVLLLVPMFFILVIVILYPAAVRRVIAFTVSIVLLLGMIGFFRSDASYEFVHGAGHKAPCTYGVERDGSCIYGH